ncbi:hypothetical protein J6590_033936 [Homalodisca vitripennis]|nr:hypothetical protein J6590_033936 [Homalodisca vitripennis]
MVRVAYVYTQYSSWDIVGDNLEFSWQKIMEDQRVLYVMARDTILISLGVSLMLKRYNEFILSFFVADFVWTSSDELDSSQISGVKAVTASDFRRCTYRKNIKTESKYDTKRMVKKPLHLHAVDSDMRIPNER